jgi:DNA-binding transcriptional ArsR family regulator
MVDLLVVLGLGLLGGIVRVLLGFARNYEQGFIPQKAWFSLFVAALSGALAAILIADDIKLAVIAGLGGADLIDALWKGLARKTAGGAYGPARGVVPIWIGAREGKALAHIRRKGKITTKEYAEYAGVSLRTAERDLSDLVKAGYIQSSGRGRAAHYRVVKTAK